MTIWVNFSLQFYRDTKFYFEKDEKKKRRYSGETLHNGINSLLQFQNSSSSGFGCYLIESCLTFDTIGHSYTPNGYIVPVEFGVHFPPHIINVPKRTKLHLNEIG